MSKTRLTKAKNVPVTGKVELTQPAYRADIDGLRGIAVLSVVGFHAFPSWVQGGFTGVDVFFVISGFLISTIIFTSLERDRFSLVEFYGRRIRRIFPALILVLVAGCAIGWFALLPNEYKQLGKHIAGGAGFVSNFVLLNESGYFDNAADVKPLLHLWSLGIEEQFYIIWPLLLWLGWKRHWNLLAITISIGVASFLLNVITVANDPIAAFYTPQCRIWELMAGSILAFISKKNRNASCNLQLTRNRWSGPIDHAHAAPTSVAVLRNVQSAAGAVLIVAGILFISTEKAFPGWWAVLPTLGALLIISAGARAWTNRAVLSNRALVWFGLISFPLYLWHWLLLSFARGIDYTEPSPAVRIAFIIVSIALAWLTYKLVEKPIRFGNHGKVTTITLVISVAIVGGGGYYGYTQNGFSFRFKDREQYLEYFDNSPPKYNYLRKILVAPVTYRYECNFWDADKYFMGQRAEVPLDSIAKSCYVRDRKVSHAVFIWGDSYAQALYYGLKNNLPPDWQILQVATSGCPANIESIQPSKSILCIHSNEFAAKAIEETRPEVVIIAQIGRPNIKSFTEISGKLTSLGVGKVIFLGSPPHWMTDLPKIIANKLWVNTPRRTSVGINKNIIANSAEFEDTFTQSDSVVFLNLTRFFCNEEGCLTYIGDDRKTGITTYDFGHLTPIASDYLAKHLLVEQIVGSTHPQ